MKPVRKLFSFLLAAVLAGCSAEEAQEPVLTSAEIPEDPAAVMLGEMNLREKILQTMMLSFSTWTLSDGTSVYVTEVNDELKEMLEIHPLGGVILFSENMETAIQTRQLTESLQETCGKPGMFIATDQEGGYITRLSMGTDLPGNMALAASRNPDLAEDAAYLTGSELDALGINVDLAPVADVNNNPGNPVIGIRSFSDDPEITAFFSSAFAAGLEKAGVIGCAKHFPGHGNTETDSHSGLPYIDSSLEQLYETELVPFQRLIQNDIGMIMTAHIQFPEIEKETVVSLTGEGEITVPATLSRTMIQDVLRGQLGYDGVVITDSLQMAAAADHFSVTDMYLRAINAGVDMVLMPVVISSAGETGLLDEFLDEIENSIEQGRLSSEALDQAVLRILRLKEKYGILDQSRFSANDPEIVGSEQHHEKEREISAACVTVLRNNGAFPPSGNTVLLAAPYATQVTSMQYQFELLKQEGIIPMETSSVGVCYDYGANSYEMIQKVQEADSVIVLSTIMDGKNILSNPSVQCIQNLIDTAHQQGKKVIVISGGAPYDTAAYPEVDGLLAVYGLGGMEVEDGKPVGDYGPNIPAALDIIYGKYQTDAKLPVNIPEADNIDILFPRG